MARHLTAALLYEGKEDAAFLCAEIESVRPEGRITADSKSEEVDEALLEIAQWYDVIFIHNDWNERDKASALCERVREVLPDHVRLVCVLPKRETEAWLLADPLLFAEHRRDGVPPSAGDVEALPDPEIPLQRALGCRHNEIDAQELGERVRLDRLAELPAYQNFLQDLTTALKELNFR